MVRPVIRFVPLVLVFALGSCTAWEENAANWNTPHGQDQTTLMGESLGNKAHDQHQMMVRDQARLHHEHAMRMPPSQVTRSGSTDPGHSDSIGLGIGR